MCQRCIANTEFSPFRRKKGFCNNCLKLALLVEDNMDVDSDGETVDFKDRETYECLFMEYYEIIKREEGLSAEDLRSAKAQLKMSENYNSSSESDEYDQDEESPLVFDEDYMDDIEEHKPNHKRKRYKAQQSTMKIKVKPNRKEFIGWGSKPLIQFLASIGKDTSEKLSQDDVTTIINGYIRENKLFHPKKKKKIECDARLRTVLGRKMVNKHRIYDILEAHLAENQELSEEDGPGYNSEDKNDVFIACKSHRKSAMERKIQKEVVEFKVPQSCFASIVAENLKLVYLRRSLVHVLLKQPETFESKIVGSFVRVKSDPNNYFQRNSHELVQVTGWS
ncbi:unnamed protein product [Ilex paraguariensis]|uniref:Uncharacterized protein n=1 Tax=Ilex paraguariensis TaxID=185542 RepID=A0ABC8QND8_9AQUA